MTSEIHRDQKWDTFIKSLDVGPEKAKGIELLTEAQKNHLLNNFTSQNNKASAFHYVTLIKSLKTTSKLLAKPKKKLSVQTPKEVLSATEISLRTNDVSWVYDFLASNGLDALLDYMKRTVKVLVEHHLEYQSLKNSKKKIYNSDYNINDTPVSNGDSNGIIKNDPSSQQVQSLTGQGLHHQSDDKVKPSFLCNKGWRNSQEDVYTNTGGRIPPHILDGIHQGVKCFRALLNNQRGLSMTFEHVDAINVITLCLLHPSFATKTQVLDLLAGICLIEHGHDAVLKAFDRFAHDTRESTRFEFLFLLFSQHENFPPEVYSIDFMISVIQLINILVHNTEDMHLRVFIQQEFRILGLDRYLQKLHSKASGNLLRQIEAFQDNEVDVGLLLKDSQLKEQLAMDIERIEAELTATLSKMANMQVEYASKISRLEDNINQLKYANEDKEKDVETLRIRLSEKEKLFVETDHRKQSDRERFLEEQIQKLENELAKKSSTISATVIAAPSSTSTIPVAPSSGPPPPPPPPPPGGRAPPAPPPPPLKGSLPPPNSQPVPIRQPFQTKYKLPVLNWTALRNNQLKNTIFVNMDDENIVKVLDLDDFEEKFKLNNNKIGCTNEKETLANGLSNGHDEGTKKQNNKKPEKKSLLDPNRHRCLGVLLKFLESEKYNIEKLWEEIARLEISPDVADRILHQLPTSEDSKLYLSYEFTDQKPIEELSDEDKLILHLCKIERLGPRLEVILFMNTFEDCVTSLEPRITAVNLASLNLKKSEKFKMVLEIILAFGNYMNSCRRGVVYGFKLQCLDVLADTKSLNRKWVLLNYIVDTIERKFPKLTNFYDELDGLAMACKVPMEILTGDVTSLKNGMKQAENELVSSGPRAPVKLVEFVEYATPRVGSISRQADQTISIYNQVVEWFGESQSKPSPEQFFSTILRFVENFKKALVDNEKRRRAEAIRLAGMNGNSQNDEIKYNGNTSSSSIRRNKDTEEKKEELIDDLKRRLAADAKRRYKNRTRQINGDGLMDEILAGLSSEPLQAEIHPKRVRGF